MSSGCSCLVNSGVGRGWYTADSVRGKCRVIHGRWHVKIGVHEGSRYYKIQLYAIGNKVLAPARYRALSDNKVGNEQWLFLPS